MHMGYGLGMGFGGFYMIIFWFFIAVGISFLIKWAIVDTTKSNHHDTALDILNKRYAGGEITKEEFETKKVALT